MNSDTIALTDDDGSPAITLDTGSVTTVAEDVASAPTVTVTASIPSGSNSVTFSADVPVTVTVAGSNTASAVDFAAVSNFTITLSAGSTSATGTFVLTPTDDEHDETDETVTVSGSAEFPSGTSLTVNSDTIALTDDDGSPAITLDTGSVTTVAEDVASAPTVTVTASIPSESNSVTFSADVPVTVTVAGSNTASAVDFAAVSNFTITLSAGSTSATGTFVLTPTDDEHDETDETVTVSGSAEFPSGTSLTVNSDTIALTDDDGSPAITLDTGSVTTVAEDVASAPTVTVTASIPSGSNSVTFSADVPVTVTVAGSNTASAVDFAAVSNFTITLSAGSTSATGTFVLTPTDDEHDETDETVTVSGSAEFPSGTSLTVNSDTIALTDDDDSPPYRALW